MAVDVVAAILRALSFIALFQAAGIVVFRALFGTRVPAIAATVRKIGLAAALLAILLLAGHYAMEAARMGGTFASVLDPSLQQIALHSPAALVLAVRGVGLALVALALRASSKGTMLGIVGVVLVIASFALMGHTVTHSPRPLLALMLLIHVAVVTFWFGALVPLYLAANRESPKDAAAVTEAFSALAVWIVPVLFAVGVVLAVFIVKTFAALRSTYGALLLAKVTGFAVLMGLATLNKWRLGPALAQGDPRIGAWFRRSLTMEYLLIAAVLSVTAVMTGFYSPD